MSSQESFASTPADSPNLSAASLPASQEIPNNMMAVGSSYAADMATRKIVSPSPPSSMTPPPSSQNHNQRRLAPAASNREITPTPSILSSPPPTALNGVKRDSSTITAEQISGATKEELRQMLEATLVENKKLEDVAAEARMNAAHYKLQYNLLAIETEDATKRMEVEHEMTRREVQVLQYACQGRENPAQDYVAKLKEYCFAVEQDNVALLQRLEKAKKLIEMKDDDLAAAREKEERLTTRIRENREHINQLRSPGGLFHVATPKQSPSYPATPLQQYRTTPKHTPLTGRSTREVRAGEDSFAALLMADRVLSQENNSAPSTPLLGHRHHADPRTPVRHNRNVQSLSSLPTTPYTNARTQAPNPALLPSVQFTPREVPRSRERRRKSRDSTISASDAEELARAAMEMSSYREGSEEVNESQASQTASEMLRMDPRESFEVAASRTHTPLLDGKNAMHQSKIYAPVTKTTVEKRKRARGDDEVGGYEKRARVGMEGVGLGIHS